VKLFGPVDYRDPAFKWPEARSGPGGTDIRSAHSLPEALPGGQEPNAKERPWKGRSGRRSVIRGGVGQIWVIIH
jgi:hypothetical protein